MSRHYFLGLAAGRKIGAAKQLFTVGRKRDLEALREALGSKYGGTAVLCKNGRSGLAIALKANFRRGDGILVNGFTCFAVVEAIKEAGCVPIYVDISRDDLNYTEKSLEKAYKDGAKGVIVQNSLGNPVDIKMVEAFAKKHELLIIEDLAHCAGIKYTDGREAGTVGAATALSFGKDKSIDTTSGGAVVFRKAVEKEIVLTKNPKLSDNLRARWYPTLAGWCRGLARVHLCGALMRLFVKLHFVEKSADNKLDITRRCTKWQAKLALQQLNSFKKSGEGVIRDFYLVNNREECMKELKKSGYHFDGFWYEKPVSPERYYAKVHFPEAECPVATEVAAQIINFPTYYKKSELEKAVKIIKPYLIEEGSK
ncbi:DegT/DnrJ/EryC1/StrS aminotransferase family protein [Candidatus Saccharibacteria bacterium]|nr:DegT/DnrJ/EryC1/StrS aminotransferase family protein [Candidatus Saccharibacteria bacterium]